MARRESDRQSRADKVRARRNNQSSKSRSTGFGNSAGKNSTRRRPPVTHRTSPTPPPVSRKRRKVYMPLKTTGAEVRLPTLPNFKLGWRLFSGILFLACLIGMISMMSMDMFTVRVINLKGAVRLTEAAVLNKLNLGEKSIVEIVPEEIANTLTETYPSLKTITVSVGLPANLTIEILERTPILAWQQDQSVYWIDSEGIMFPPHGEAEIPITVLANSNPPAAIQPEVEADQAEETLQETVPTDISIWPTTTPAFVSGVLALSEYVPAEANLLYDPQFGLGWEDPLEGWLVYFGNDISNIAIKLAEYQTIINKFRTEDIKASLISLEFLHAPFYQLEQ